MVNSITCRARLEPAQGDSDLSLTEKGIENGPIRAGPWFLGGPHLRVLPDRVHDGQQVGVDLQALVGRQVVVAQP